MAQEKVFQDFSGGMNALAAVDKLDPRECLLAENVRLDETGNVLSAGAATAQNAVTYNNKVHSLYWNPGFGGIAGVGISVVQGLTLGALTNTALFGANPAQQKMSFASAPNRVYFDVGSTGYWSDQTNLLTVDWAPPVTVSSLGGPSIVGAGANVGGGTAAWQSPNNITSTSGVSVATVPLVWSGAHTSGQLQATMTTNSFAVSTASAIGGVRVTMGLGAANGANVTSLQVTLLKGGVPVGTVKTLTPTTATSTATFGSPTDLWGATLTAADVNASNFGFQVVAVLLSDPGQSVSIAAFNGVMTVYSSAASTGMVAGTGAAGTLTGTYQWKVTFVAANGEESDGSSDTVGVVLSAQQGALTAINTGDARTVARNLYRKGGTLTSHYLVGTIQDNSSTTYSDNMTDILALATGVILAGDVPGDYPNSRLGQTASVRFPALHYDRTFWIVPGTNKIIWSKPLNGFAYPAINTLNVGDGKPCTRVVSIFGELIIIKTDSIWRLTGNDETSFDLTQTPSAVGTDMSFTIVALPDKIIFANRWGLWVFNGYTSVPLTTKLDLWFKQDDRTNEELFGVNGFHPPEVASSTVPLNFDACGNSEKYYLAYAEAGQANNNAAIVFDVKHGNITKRAGVNPLSLAIDPVNGFVYVGDTGGFISLLDDWNGSGQVGSAANFDFQTAYIDLERGSNKTLWALEFFLDTDGQLLTPSVYYDNGNASETLAPISTASLARVVRPVEASAARKMQNFSVRLNGSIKPINKSGSPQIQFVHIKAFYDLRTGRARTGQ